MDQERIYPWDRRSIGMQQTWYTRAVRRWEKYLGPTGAAGWFCPKCDYCPSYQSELPNERCGNCQEQMAVQGPGEGVTEITVKVTDYGFERLSIGPKRGHMPPSLPGYRQG